MSLWLIETVAPIIEYEPCSAIGGFTYNPWLCEEPRIYMETVDRVNHFFYEPSNDRLVAYIWFLQRAWPGWAVWRYEWDANTGNFISRTEANYIGMAWSNHAGIGSYNKIYTTWNSATKISEIYWDTLSRQNPMWEIDPYTWSPSTIFTHAAVNREDMLIAGIASWNLQVWDISGTPTRLATMRLPNTLGYLAYESREICWVITQDGLILKANYKRNPPRWEMLSSVQNPAPDAINYFITWDQKRARIVVLRQLPDAEDGACRSQFEFYRPLVKIIGLTDPVPVGRHRGGDITEFVAHLYGSSGEGITPYKINASLQLPAKGIMLKGEGASAQNGAVSFLYQAPLVTGQDTMILTTTINDGVL